MLCCSRSQSRFNKRAIIPFGALLCVVYTLCVVLAQQHTVSFDEGGRSSQRRHCAHDTAALRIARQVATPRAVECVACRRRCVCSNGDRPYKRVTTTTISSLSLSSSSSSSSIICLDAFLLCQVFENAITLSNSQPVRQCEVALKKQLVHTVAVFVSYSCLFSFTWIRLCFSTINCRPS
jgi:hypothetical protein